MNSNQYRFPTRPDHFFSHLIMTVTNIDYNRCHFAQLSERDYSIKKINYILHKHTWSITKESKWKGSILKTHTINNVNLILPPISSAFCWDTHRCEPELQRKSLSLFLLFQSCSQQVLLQRKISWSWVWLRSALDIKMPHTGYYTLIKGQRIQV